MPTDFGRCSRSQNRELPNLKYIIWLEESGKSGGFNQISKCYSLSVADRNMYFFVDYISDFLRRYSVLDPN